MSGYYKFAAAVAEFGMLQRTSKFKAYALLEQVLSPASKPKGIDEKEDSAEYIRLVESAQLLSESITGDIE